MSEDPASVGASDRAAASEAIPAADSAKVPVESATEDQATLSVSHPGLGG